jgi:hypothetical protein
VDGAEHIFEEGMLYVRVRFTDQSELCWVLQTAHVILEADLVGWTTGDFKQQYIEGLVPATPNSFGLATIGRTPTQQREKRG